MHSKSKAFLYCKLSEIEMALNHAHFLHQKGRTFVLANAVSEFVVKIQFVVPNFHFKTLVAQYFGITIGGQANFYVVCGNGANRLLGNYFLHHLNCSVAFVVGIGAAQNFVQKDKSRFLPERQMICFKRLISAKK